MTLTPRKLLVAAVATAALGACTNTLRAPAAPSRVVAVPAPVSAASVAPDPAPPVVVANPAPALELEAPAAQPRTDEHDRPLCGNVRTKRAASDCQ